MMSSYIATEWMLSHNKMFQARAAVRSFLTFDLQPDLVLSLAQNAAGHAGVGALVLSSGPFDLQGAVDVNTVLTTIQPTALSVLKP